MNSLELWKRYREYLNVNSSVGVTVDISRMVSHREIGAKQ